jgi:very-short-patch-repair endonuclease
MPVNRAAIPRARQLRRRPSLPEGLLWQCLRSRPAGLKFRRQHPLGPYVLDFFCREAGVAIEVDGISHEMGDNPERDRERDEWVDGRNIRTLRIPAGEVLGDIEAVVTFIVAKCRERTPLR